MKHLLAKLLNYCLLSLTVLVATACLSAQSTDAGNATALTSNEIVIKGPKKVDQQYYYSFTAGPGEVTVMLVGKAKQYSTFIGLKVYDSGMNLLASHNMSATQSSAGIAKKTLEVGDKQTLVLSFTSDTNLSECKITLSGAVELAASGSPSQTNSSLSSVTDLTTTNASASEPKFEKANDSQSSTGADGTVDATGTVASAGKNKSFLFSLLDAAGQRFNVPANGKLRIEMKDGTIQELDLTQVKKLLIKK